MGLRPPHFECGALPIRATPPGSVPAGIRSGDAAEREREKLAARYRRFNPRGLFRGGYSAGALPRALPVAGGRDALARLTRTPTRHGAPVARERRRRHSAGGWPPVPPEAPPTVGRPSKAQADSVTEIASPVLRCSELGVRERVPQTSDGRTTSVGWDGGTAAEADSEG